VLDLKPTGLLRALGPGEITSRYGYSQQAARYYREPRRTQSTLQYLGGV
jgi:hypothetical protein